MANVTGQTQPTQNKPVKNEKQAGVVMGPDGKPCKPCTAFRNWRPQTTNHTEAQPKRVGGSAVKQVAAAATASSQSTKSAALLPDEPPAGCPPDVEQLGRATWTFLHSAAAYYPEKPTPTQRANMLMLLRSLPVLYPCHWCADDFGKDINQYPPDVSGRTALSQWLCDRHNQVNKKLGKETFDCSKVDERWKDGPSDGSCD
ncbi:ERV/ALR sulfhydryl oxidase domain-containing protein [Panaeolus papilionaceus]|nr:ERV/ALR sulfhydryl oxidase domain-containing protein [Panaeolus papilionaceus]